MRRLTGNRLSLVPITIFTFFTVTASFCLAAVEPLRTATFVAERADNTEERIDSIIPSPAKEPALLTKTDDLQPMPPRTGFQRIFDPYRYGGIHSAASVFCRSSSGTNSIFDYINAKNTILLKLRI
jgi:hypothetical protein